jgi:hypothetical protein
MNSPAESYPQNVFDQKLQKFHLTEEIRRAFNSHQYEAEILMIEETPENLRMETILGGVVVRGEVDDVEYTDVTLLWSTTEGHQLTSLVVNGEQYDILDDSPDKVSLASLPQHFLDGKAINEVRGWVNDATWSKETTLRLTEQRRRSQQAPQIPPTN